MVSIWTIWLRQKQVFRSVADTPLHIVQDVARAGPSPRIIIYRIINKGGNGGRQLLWGQRRYLCSLRLGRRAR